MPYRENAYRSRGFVRKCKCTETQTCDWHQRTSEIYRDVSSIFKAISLIGAIIAWVSGGILLMEISRRSLWMFPVVILTVVGAFGMVLAGVTWPALPNWVRSLRDAHRNSFEYVEEEE